MFTSIGLVLIFVLFIMVRRANTRADRMETRVRRLECQLAGETIEEIKTARQPDSVNKPEREISPEPKKAEREKARPEIARQSDSETTPLFEFHDKIKKDTTCVTAPEGADSENRFSGQLEENLASRWFVWVGAVAIAIAGIFLVKYIAEQQLLTPRMRIILASLLGTVLTAGGQWVRQRPFSRQLESTKPYMIPLALTASGLFILYAAIYGGYALYGLIPPLITFGLLAVVSFSAFTLSVLQGAPVAVMGLLGGMATPMLIQAQNPSAVGLFGYLLMIVTACGAVTHFRPWIWLGFGAIASSAAWVLIWIFGYYHRTDMMIMGGFILATMAVSALKAPPSKEGKPEWLSQLQTGISPQMQSAVAWTGIVVCSILIAITIFHDNYSPASLFVLACFVSGLVSIAIVRHRLDLAMLGAGALVVLVFGNWSVLLNMKGIAAQFNLTDRTLLNLALPQSVTRYVSWAAAFSVTTFTIGFAFLTRQRRPWIQASTSAGTTLFLLIATYFALQEVYPDWVWAVLAICYALVALYSTIIVVKKDRDDLHLALGIYASAVSAGLSLAMVFLLRDAWLTVALSLQLPALAWISNRLGLPQLRKVALAITAVIFTRLALNPFALDYATNHFLGTHWVIYGYGIPAIATHLAFRWFFKFKDDRLAVLLEGLRIVFIVLLITAEIRIFATGSLITSQFSFKEAGYQSIAWLVVALTRFKAWNHSGRMSDKLSALILFSMAVLTTFIVSLLIENPVFSHEATGRMPIINTLLTGYAIPAAIIWFILQVRPLPLPKKFDIWIRGGVLLLTFVWITLETKHFFQGSVMKGYALSDAETYSYSAIWLVMAFTLLIIGFLRMRPIIRYAALIIMVITVLKVFLSDMAGLEGLWRVASFLGLGLSLVGIGFLYQRFLYANKSPQSANKIVTHSRNG